MISHISYFVGHLLCGNRNEWVRDKPRTNQTCYNSNKLVTLFLQYTYFKQDGTIHSYTTLKDYKSIRAVQLPQISHKRLHSWALVYHSSMRMMHTNTIEQVGWLFFILCPPHTTISYVIQRVPSSLVSCQDKAWVKPKLDSFAVRQYGTCVMAIHLTASLVWGSSPHLPVTPVELVRPGIGCNAPHTVGDFV